MKKRINIVIALILIFTISIISPVNTAFAWTADGHEASVSSSASYQSMTNAFYQVVIRKAARVADSGIYSSNVNMALHGGTTFNADPATQAGTNYVQGLMYLYHTAYLYKNYSTYTKDQIFTKASADIITKTGSDVDEDYKTVAKAVVDETFVFYDATYNNSTLYPQDTNIVRAYKLIGFACHLAGDIHCHRTMVPVTSLTNGTFTTSLFNTTLLKADDTSIKNYCWHEITNSYLQSTVSSWSSFVQGLVLGVMEFKDIKFFTLDRTTGGTTYEDNSSCYSARYSVATNFSVNYVITKFKSNVSHLDVGCLLPGPAGFTYSLQLDNLKNFYTGVGFTWSSSWNSYTTTDLK